jgi:hypothetical protein
LAPVELIRRNVDRFYMFLGAKTDVKRYHADTVLAQFWLGDPCQAVRHNRDSSAGYVRRHRG